jgi:hypothetical protein
LKRIVAILETAELDLEWQVARLENEREQFGQAHRPRLTSELVQVSVVQAGLRQSLEAQYRGVDLRQRVGAENHLRPELPDRPAEPILPGTQQVP